LTEFHKILHNFEAKFINFKYFVSKFLSEAVPYFEVEKTSSWCSVLNVA